MATIELERLNLTPGMRAGQRFAWSGSLDGDAIGLVFYSRADLQGWPGDYDANAVKVGSWSFDLLDARGVALVRGVLVSVGIDMLWSYHGYDGVPAGKLIAWTSDGLDLGLDAFAGNTAEIYYQGVVDVLATSSDTQVTR